MIYLFFSRRLFFLTVLLYQTLGPRQKHSGGAVLVSFGVEPFSQPGHSREGGNPVHREAHSQWFTAWIPAFAGMTVRGSDEVWQMTPVDFRGTD